jgi:hypothetical protein
LIKGLFVALCQILVHNMITYDASYPARWGAKLSLDLHAPTTEPVILDRLVLGINAAVEVEVGC